MDIRSLIPMAGNRPNRFLIESISDKQPQILDRQHQDFLKALGDEGESEVFCFYETMESPTAQQVCNFSSLFMYTDLLIFLE